VDDGVVSRSYSNSRSKCRSQWWSLQLNTTGKLLPSAEVTGHGVRPEQATPADVDRFLNTAPRV